MQDCATFFIIPVSNIHHMLIAMAHGLYKYEEYSPLVGSTEYEPFVAEWTLQPMWTWRRWREVAAPD